LLTSRAGTDAGDALGREAVGAGAGASGASIKAGDRPQGPRCRRQDQARRAGERSTAKREALDAADVPLDVPRRVLSWPARTNGVFWDRE